MKKIIYLLFFIGSILITSCNDLDLYPLSEGSSENWYSDETEIELAVQDLYRIEFWRLVLDWNTDDYTIRNATGPMASGTVTAEWSYAVNTWALAYKSIARANAILANLDRAQDNVVQVKLDRFAGEARFVRASRYADLISRYGDVPYFENVLDIDESFTLARTDKNTILQKIYDDYDYAASVLPIDYGGTSIKRATKGAALALKARIALYMGDYAVARDAAKACIDLNVYNLYPDFEKLFLTKNVNENIFLIPRSVELGVEFGYNTLEKADGENSEPFSVFHTIPRNLGGYAMMDPSWDLFCSYLCTDGLPVDESPLFDPRSPFKNRDPRCAATIVEFGSIFLGITFQPHPDSLQVYDYNNGRYIKNNDSRANTQYASYNGLVWRKGIDETWIDDKKAENDKVIIRFADVLLMYAEAKIELNEIDGSVLDAINQVRARAYKNDPEYPAVTTVNQAELRKIVRLERRMEFANENLRYMDIIRWRLAEKVLNIPIYGMLNGCRTKGKSRNPGTVVLAFCSRN